MFDLRKVFSANIREMIMYSLSFLPDSLYLKIFYFATTGKRLNLKKPIGYNEKLQWLKIHEQKKEYSTLVDKLAVKGYIEEKLGAGYTFRTLGYWDSFDKIDFSDLPEKFVLKCNHDSGSTKVIANKKDLSQEKIKALKKFYDRRMKRDFYCAGREYPYKGLKRYIMAEQYMEDENAKGMSIEDYKFFCFDGVPKIMFVATDRGTDCKFDFYDMDFQHLDIVNIHPNADKHISKPKCFEEMKTIAAQLSQGMKTVRIDLYEINGKIYFGEFTFFHGGGFRLFEPACWEAQLGEWIEIKNGEKELKKDL